MNSCELVALVSTVGAAIAKAFTAEEAAVLATIFTQLGDSIATTLA